MIDNETDFRVVFCFEKILFKWCMHVRVPLFHNTGLLTNTVVGTEDERLVEAGRWIRGRSQPVACWDIRGDNRHHTSCCHERSGHTDVAVLVS